VPFPQIWCPHKEILGQCKRCPVKYFHEKYWTHGWALDAYTNLKGKTRLGTLVHTIKYRIQNDPEAARVKSQLLLDTLKEFLVNTYPMRRRPFDCLVHPPSNTEREFQLMDFLCTQLSYPNMQDRSKQLINVSSHETVKAMSGQERFATLPNTMKFITDSRQVRPSGVLILDDVLGTGNTAKEVCRALEVEWPGVPRYYVSLTYLMHKSGRR